MATIKLCTNLEQSQKLIELGIDISTADMFWWHNTEEKSYEAWLIDYAFVTDMDIPAWSLTALLELTPNDVSLLHLEDAYQAVYDVKPYYITNKFDNPLDAAFDMVCWLKENNKI